MGAVREHQGGGTGHLSEVRGLLKSVQGRVQASGSLINQVLYLEADPRASSAEPQASGRWSLEIRGVTRHLGKGGIGGKICKDVT